MNRADPSPRSTQDPPSKGWDRTSLRHPKKALQPCGSRYPEPCTGQAAACQTVRKDLGALSQGDSKKA